MLLVFGVQGCCAQRPRARHAPTKPATPPPSAPRCNAHDASCDPQVRSVLGRGGVDPDSIHCSTLVRWEPSLGRYARQLVQRIAEAWGVTPEPKARERAEHHALGYLVRSYYDQVSPQNLGVTLVEGHSFVDDKGERHPLLLFRSAVTTSPTGACPCFESLVRNGRVRHVVNLYGGTFPFRDMIEREKKLAHKLGVSYFDAAEAPKLAFRRLVEHPQDYRRNQKQAARNLARLINEQLLHPKGQQPRGNLYIHCGGGMHRSGMLFGVIQRCINRVPLEQIEAEYKRHTGYISDSKPGGYEALNVRFIADFDCTLLTKGEQR